MHRLNGYLGVVAEDMGYRIIDIMDMHILEFGLVQRRAGEDLEEVVVIDPIGLAGTEHDPVTVKNNKFQHAVTIR
jgi:hypothetical protein